LRDSGCGKLQEPLPEGPSARPGRLIDLEMPAQIAGIVISHFLPDRSLKMEFALFDQFLEVLRGMINRNIEGTDLG